MNWLPAGSMWMIEKTRSAVTFIARADGIRVESDRIYKTEREAKAAAKDALRRAAYNKSTSGWNPTRNRVHAVVNGQSIAFCGAKVGNIPNLNNDFSFPCGNCERIIYPLAEMYDEEPA